jgi:hypothetical protein
MSRPIYCRPTDDDNDARVMAALVARLNRDGASCFRHAGAYDYLMSTRLAPYDAVLLKNSKEFAIVEVKNRTGEGSRFAEWHIAQHKIEALRTESRRRGLRAFLVFVWSGMGYLVDVAKLPGDLKTHVSGRYDRHDPADEEIMVLIPAKLFSKI